MKPALSGFLTSLRRAPELIHPGGHTSRVRSFLNLCNIVVAENTNNVCNSLVKKEPLLFA